MLNKTSIWSRAGIDSRVKVLLMDLLHINYAR